jgi:hypothetical protein
MQSHGGPDEEQRWDGERLMGYFDSTGRLVEDNPILVDLEKVKQLGKLQREEDARLKEETERLEALERERQKRKEVGCH